MLTMKLNTSGNEEMGFCFESILLINILWLSWFVNTIFALSDLKFNFRF